MPEIGPPLRAFVRARAARRCEYCQIPESLSLLSHEIDHIRAVKHGGLPTEDNLALCCTICNKYKGTDLTSIDPSSGALVSLFHPRRDSWNNHFARRGSTIEGITPTGRVTARLLQFNRPERLQERQLMLQARVYD